MLPIPKHYEAACIRRDGFHSLFYESLMKDIGRFGSGTDLPLAHTEQMSATQFQKMMNGESRMLGVSKISSDMRDLLAREATDVDLMIARSVIVKLPRLRRLKP